MSLPLSYRIYRFFLPLRNALFPALCSLCKEPLEKQEPLCPKCLGEYRASRLRDCGQCGKQLDTCTCSSDMLRKARVKRHVKLFRYRPGHEKDAESRIVFALKHHNLELLFTFMGKELFDCFSSIMPEENYVVTYVPRTPRQEIENGYDHARFLAMTFSEASGYDFQKTLLRKNRSAKEQKRMETVSLRLKNVKDGFALCKGADLKGKRVILIDDIVTTGASVAECAKVLRREGGAKEVIEASLAVVPHNINPLFTDFKHKNT